MPKVSILIPAYNHQEYVKQTLDSILEEGFEKKEICIVDDGSSDKTAEVIADWVKVHKAKIAISYRSRPNKGLTKTLNELLSMAQGEYLVTLASDDYLLKGGIAKRLSYLQSHPAKYAVFSDCIVVDERGTILSESGLFSYRQANKANFLSDAGIRREFLTNFAMPGPVLMVKRDFYKEFGAYNETIYMEDYDLYLRFAAKNLIGFLDEKVSAYRIHKNNISLSGSGSYLRILRDSQKTLWLRRKDFRGYEKFLLYKQIGKFGVRIMLQHLKTTFRSSRLGS